MNRNHLAAIILGLTLTAACDSPRSSGADTVFIGGSIYTVDDDRSWAEGVAVTDGEIVFVGSSEQAQSFIGANTDVVDLDGNLLMPGFHDGHAHVNYGGTASLGCNLQSEQDIDKIRAVLVECASL